MVNERKSFLCIEVINQEIDLAEEFKNNDCYICGKDGVVYSEYWLDNKYLQNNLINFKSILDGLKLKYGLDDEWGIAKICSCSEHSINLNRLDKIVKKEGFLTKTLVKKSLEN
ncbi:MAG: hypothetical protein WC812_03220 [Candidatus Pacearchaeota archaeon]|jgi:hypothetical protein